MHKREDFHHTQEQVSLAVAQACAILAEYELSDEDNTALLPTLVTLLSSKQIFYEEVGPIPDLALPHGARH